MVLIRVFICALFCCVVNCTSNEFKRQSVTLEEIDTHEEQCMNHNTALKKNVFASKCIPRDTVVRVTHKKSTYKMIPNIAVVKRCYNVGCPGNRTCLPVPTSIKYRQVAVSIMDRYGSNHPKCSWVNVIEHTKCKCGCLVPKEKCEGMNRMFDSTDCTCKCKNGDQAARKECSQNKNMFWDEENCMCTCPAGGMQCSTGTTWVPQFCRCMQINMNQRSIG